MIEYADVIVDLQQGDSGKGKIASYLAEKGDYTHVIRYNGGNNAGHTIYVDGKKVVTHSIPVGAIHGIKSVIGPGCVLNVEHFFNELREIEESGFNVRHLVKVAGNTHIITESHLKEEGSETKIGTTRRGNGPAYRDKYDRKGIRAADVPELRPFIIDMYEELYGDECCRILFEGAQGFYLDIDWGEYPYVTSSHCTVGSAVMNGVPPQKIRKVFGVAKAYETYVGTKKFEPQEEVFSLIREAGKEYGATTGRPRQCNWLNIDNLIKASRVNGVTDLVINKADVLKEVSVWKAYLQGKVVEFSSEESFRAKIVESLSCKNIYWSEDTYSIGKKISSI